MYDTAVDRLHYFGALKMKYGLMDVRVLRQSVARDFQHLITNSCCKFLCEFIFYKDVFYYSP